MTLSVLKQVAQELNVRFLVLIGGIANQEEHDEVGIMALMLMPAGVMMYNETSVLSSVIIDLEHGDITCRLRSQADGTTVILAWVAPVAILPMTSRSAVVGLANAILEEIAQEEQHTPVRLAVMGAEVSGDPFVPYEGAPVPLGWDPEVNEMVERLSNLKDDIVVGITRYDEIGERLGIPLASYSALRVEIYRLTALAQCEIRPLFFVVLPRWTAR